MAVADLELVTAVTEELLLLVDAVRRSLLEASAFTKAPIRLLWPPEVAEVGCFQTKDWTGTP